uniref:Fibrinogen-like protein 1 n=1 Tax=Drosophila rhopaloa TaxID=1041015 RepID=A0A6P4ERQ3_DRORH
MKSGFLMIFLSLWLLKGLSLTGAGPVQNVHLEPSNSSIKNPCFEYSSVKPLLDRLLQLNVELIGKSNTLAESLKALQSMLSIAETEKKIKEVPANKKGEEIKTTDDLIKEIVEQAKEPNTNFENESFNEPNSTPFDLEIQTESVELSESKVILPSSCRRDLANDTYQIELRGMKPFYVFCGSAEGNDSGWMVIQRRFDGSENFHRYWEEYVDGFGDIKGEFFIGLEKLHIMTTDKQHELHIKLGMFNGSTAYAHYDHFVIGSKDDFYRLENIGQYNGTAGDSLEQHLSRKFSTRDYNNDSLGNSCPADESGGWWYFGCGQSQLNGKFYKDGQSKKSNGILWGTFQDYKWRTSLTTVEMLIRPI